MAGNGATGSIYHFQLAEADSYERRYKYVRKNAREGKAERAERKRGWMGR